LAIRRAIDRRLQPPVSKMVGNVSRASLPQRLRLEILFRISGEAEHQLDRVANSDSSRDIRHARYGFFSDVADRIQSPALP
jgi:hypothetical protein